MRLLDRNHPSSKRLDALRALSLFAECSNKQLELIDSRTDQIAVPTGETLIREGQLNHTFFLLLSGSVQITRASEPVVTLGPGDFFGEISMVGRDAATATVITTSECQLLVMSHQQFRDAVMGSDDILAPVLRAIQQRSPDAELADI